MQQEPALTRQVRSSGNSSSSAKLAEVCTWEARAPAWSAPAGL